MTDYSLFRFPGRTRSRIRALLGGRGREPRPLIFPPGGIGLIWSHKSACTTSILWYLAVAGQLDEALDFHQWPHEYRIRVLPNREDYRTWLADCSPTSLRWARVVRDPYKRAVSSFRHALAHGYEDHAIAGALGLNRTRQGFSFNEFLQYLETIDISRCDGHHREQWNPLEKWIRPERIINADREPVLDVLFSFAAPQAPARKRLQKEVDRIATRHHAKRTGDRNDCAEVVFQSSSARGPWPEYEAFLTAATRSKIERIYAKDLEAYADIW